MYRRRLIVAGVAVAMAVAVDLRLAVGAANVGKKDVLVGYLELVKESDGEMLYREFVEGIRERGYFEGRNLRILRRSAEGRLERVRPLAAELAAARVDVIVATSAEAARSAKNGAPRIPTVFVIANDPVLEGLVASLSRPQGQVTGLTHGEDLSAKRLELLKEAFPAIRKVAVLGSNLSISRARYDVAAGRLGLDVQPFPVHGTDDYRDAAAAISRGAADAILVVDDADAVPNLRAFVLVMTATGRPVMFNADVFVDEGGLMAYGASLRQLYRRAAHLAARLVEGAKAADIPVEQPTRYELVIKLRAAENNAIVLPREFLKRADRVIR